MHGGGRAIDAELRARGETPRFVDGLRVTDAAALDTVVAVLAGRNNTALVAAIGAAGARAVGLTGADGGIGRSRAGGHVRRRSAGSRSISGWSVSPTATDVALLHDLLRLGYIPGGREHRCRRVGHAAERERRYARRAPGGGASGRRLIVAGATAGVLDGRARRSRGSRPEAIDDMTASGTAHSGMVAKLAACRRALDGGVTDIAIVSGRGVTDFATATGTKIEPALPAGGQRVSSTREGTEWNGYDDSDRRHRDRERSPAAGVPPRIRSCSSAAADAGCSTRTAAATST